MGGEQKQLILDKVTGRVAFPAALAGQRLAPGTIQSHMGGGQTAAPKLSLVALKRGTEVSDALYAHLLQ